MRTNLFAILILAVGCFVGFAQNERYLTLTVLPDNSGNASTNSYSVEQNQAVELMGLQPAVGGNATLVHLWIFKSGASFVADNYPKADGGGGVFGIAPSRGTIIQGPAMISISSSLGVAAFATLKVTPESYDPNKTIIVPPGTNQVQITLQVSSDLVNWTTATNGVYGSPTTAQFFRIRQDNLVSP